MIVGVERSFKMWNPESWGTELWTISVVQKIFHILGIKLEGVKNYHKIVSSEIFACSGGGGFHCLQYSAGPSPKLLFCLFFAL